MSSVSTVDDFNGESLPYDSLFNKFCCSVPYVGHVLDLILENRINAQMYRSLEAPKLVKMIELKNDYKIAGIIRNILAVVFPIFGGISLIFGLGFALVNYLSFNHNQRMLKEIATTGYRPEMEIR